MFKGLFSVRMCDVIAGGQIGQSYVDSLNVPCVRGGGAGRTFLPEAVSARMRKRRCFADTELNAIMLEQERAHALLTRQTTTSQQRILFPLPVTPYQLPPPDLACRQLDDAAMRLLGLVRSCRTLPSGVSEAGMQSTASECWPASGGLTSKSSIDNVFDVGGKFSRPLPPKVDGLGLSVPYTGALSLLGGLPTIPSIFRTTTTRPTTENQESATEVTHHHDHRSSWTDASSDFCRLLITKTQKDSEEEHRRLKPKSLRRTFDFSVESLLAK